MLTRRSLLVSVFLTALAATCCGGGERNMPPATIPAGAVVVSDGELGSTRQIASLSDYQTDLLSDGILTLQEYETAYVAVLACLTDAGFTILREMPPTLSRSHSFQAVRMTGGETARADLQSCTDTYVSFINPIWARHHHFSEKEVQAARNLLADCLRETATVEFPPVPSKEDFREYLGSQAHRDNPQAFAQCQIRTEQEHGIPNFGG